MIQSQNCGFLLTHTDPLLTWPLKRVWNQHSLNPRVWLEIYSGHGLPYPSPKESWKAYGSIFSRDDGAPPFLQWCSVLGEQFCLPGAFQQCLETFGIVTAGEGCSRHLMRRIAANPGMLLTILQYTGQLPSHQQRIMWPKMSVASRARNSGPEL